MVWLPIEGRENDIGMLGALVCVLNYSNMHVVKIITFFVNVEWIFGDIINYFKFLDFKKDLKLQLSAIGKMYLVCAILQNAHTCLYGNKTSKYFGLQAVNIEIIFSRDQSF